MQELTKTVAAAEENTTALQAQLNDTKLQLTNAKSETMSVREASLAQVSALNEKIRVAGEEHEQIVSALKHAEQKAQHRITQISAEGDSLTSTLKEQLNDTTHQLNTAQNDLRLTKHNLTAAQQQTTEANAQKQRAIARLKRGFETEKARLRGVVGKLQSDLALERSSSAQLKLETTGNKQLLQQRLARLQTATARAEQLANALNLRQDNLWLQVASEREAVEVARQASRHARLQTELAEKKLHASEAAQADDPSPSQVDIESSNIQNDPSALDLSQSNLLLDSAGFALTTPANVHPAPGEATVESVTKLPSPSALASDLKTSKAKANVNSSMMQSGGRSNEDDLLFENNARVDVPAVRKQKERCTKQLEFQTTKCEKLIQELREAKGRQQNAQQRVSATGVELQQNVQSAQDHRTKILAASSARIADALREHERQVDAINDEHIRETRAAHQELVSPDSVDPSTDALRNPRSASASSTASQGLLSPRVTQAVECAQQKKTNERRRG